MINWTCRRHGEAFIPERSFTTRFAGLVSCDRDRKAKPECVNTPGLFFTIAGDFSSIWVYPQKQVTQQQKMYKLKLVSLEPLLIGLNFVSNCALALLGSERIRNKVTTFIIAPSHVQMVNDPCGEPRGAKVVRCAAHVSRPFRNCGAVQHLVGRHRKDAVSESPPKT